MLLLQIWIKIDCFAVAHSPSLSLWQCHWYYWERGEGFGLFSEEWAENTTSSNVRTDVGVHRHLGNCLGYDAVWHSAFSSFNSVFVCLESGSLSDTISHPNRRPRAESLLQPNREVWVQTSEWDRLRPKLENKGQIPHTKFIYARYFQLGGQGWRLPFGYRNEPFSMQAECVSAVTTQTHWGSPRNTRVQYILWFSGMRRFKSPFGPRRGYRMSYPGTARHGLYVQKWTELTANKFWFQYELPTLLELGDKAISRYRKNGINPDSHLSSGWIHLQILTHGFIKMILWFILDLVYAQAG